MNPRRRRHNKRARRAVRLGVPGCPVRKFDVGDSKVVFRSVESVVWDFLAMVGTLPEVLKRPMLDLLLNIAGGICAMVFILALFLSTQMDS